MKGIGIHWSDYLYVGAAFAILLFMSDPGNDGFYQLVLFVAFFVCTGLKGNVERFKSFVRRFPVYFVITVLLTVYSLFVDNEVFISYRYPGIIYLTVFGGFVIAQQEHDTIAIAINKLWALLMSVLGVGVFQYLAVHDFTYRMNLFLKNPIPEADTALVLTILSLYFMRNRYMKALGTLLSLVVIVFSKTRHGLVLFSIVVFTYLWINRKTILDFIRSRRIQVGTIILIVIALGMVFILKSDRVVFTSFFRRFSALGDALGKDPYLDYYGDRGYAYRLMAPIETLKIYRKGNFWEILFGRGLKSTFATIKIPLTFITRSTNSGQVENVFFAFLHDYGFFAFAISLGVYITATISFARAKDRTVKAVSLLVTMMWSVCLFADMQYWNSIAFYMWVFTGLWLGISTSEWWKKIFTLSIIFSMTAAIVLCVMPVFYSWLRTTRRAISDNCGNGVVTVFFVTVLLALLFLLWSISAILEQWLLEKKRNAKAEKCAAISVSALLLLILLGNINTGIIKPRICEQIQIEKNVIETVKNGADGDVYCDTYPSVYNASFEDIKGTLYSCASLATERNVTVIMSVEDEAQRLTDAGFLYQPISEWSVIYSNDQGAIDALKKLGFNPTGYYTKEYSASIGKKIEIYPGEYTAKCTLRLSDSGDYNEDYEVGTVSLVSAKGEESEKEIVSKTLMRSNFDEKGVLTEELEFFAGGNNYTFELSTESDDNVEIESIEYTRTPDYDIHFVTDENYRVAREEYFDHEGNPVEKEGGYHGIDYEYDSEGTWLVKRFLGLDFKPVISSDGFAEIRRYFDDAHRLVREEYYGEDLQPIVLSGGQSAVEYVYDGNNNRSVTRYYDEEFKPVLYNGQYYCVKVTYDDNRQNILEEYFGTGGEPVLMPDGATAYRREYDGTGNVVCLTYMGEDGSPVISTYGYAILKRAFDEEKRVIREDYLDVNANPIERADGQAAVEYGYDEVGNRNMEQYFDAEGAPTLYKGNYFRLKRTYDVNKRVVLEEYFNTDESPIVLSDGASGYEYEYDSAGNNNVIWYLDAEGNPVINTSGYAILKREFDSDGRVIREDYLDTDSKPIALRGGQATVEYGYDEAGNRSSYRYFDIEGAPVLCGGSYFHEMRTYNDQKQMILAEYFDTDEKPIVLSDGASEYRYEYDSTGNLTMIWYLDAEGNPVVNTAGYTVLERKYNNEKRVVRENYLDADLNPVILEGGQAAVEYKYDVTGNRTVTLFFGASGEPILYYGEYWYVEVTYDEDGAVVAKCYYDLDGNVVKEE